MYKVRDILIFIPDLNMTLSNFGEKASVVKVLHVISEGKYPYKMRDVVTKTEDYASDSELVVFSELGKILYC